MIGYGKCPRCGVWGLEHLETHSHCWECNYFPEEKSSHRLWSFIEFRFSLFGAQRRAAEDDAYLGHSASMEPRLSLEMKRLLTNPIGGIL